jgi:hypothetical protein
VEKVTRKAKIGAPEEKIEQGVSVNVKKEEDVDMSDDSDSKPRKKKEKKVITVGWNGLKKRLVTKTRTIKKDDSWSMWHPFVYFTYRNNDSPVGLGTQV